MEQKEFKGDLEWISPDKIIKGNDIVGSFFIGFGTIFNDLKDLILFEQLIVDSYRKPQADECSAHMGSYGGIMIHIKKLIASTINEFFIFLEKNDDVLNTAEFKDILEKLPKLEKEEWNGMVSAAHGKLPKASDFIKTLVRIRSNFTYHYYQSGKVLGRGFRSRFSNEQKDERNKCAYYSIGETLGLTRFYFSDAAVEEALYIEAGKGEKKKIIGDASFEKYHLQINATIEIMSKVIMLLLKKFLQTRRNNSK